MKLHEIAYREAQFRGATTSLAIRRYVAFISSKEILKSELIFWGHPTNLYRRYHSDAPVSREYPAASRSIMFASNSVMEGVIVENFSAEKISITLEGVKLNCSGLTIKQLDYF
jgi:hypothetical protein